MADLGSSSACSFRTTWKAIRNQRPVLCRTLWLRFLFPTFMSSSRACEFSIPSGTHFLLSGSDSSFSTSILSPLSSKLVKWVHLLVGSDAGESRGVWIKSKEVDPGLQLSSESTDKAVLRFWTLRLSGEQGPSWAKLPGFSQCSSLTWVFSHESSFVSWLRESEKGLPVFVLVSVSERKERRCSW